MLTKHIPSYEEQIQKNFLDRYAEQTATDDRHERITCYAAVYIIIIPISR